MRVRKALSVAVVACSMFFAAPASASQFATSEYLPASELGLPGVVTLARPAAAREIAVPVPVGTELSGIDAVIRVPADVQQVRLNISVDGVEFLQDVVPGGTELPVSVAVETNSQEPLVRFAAVEINTRSCNAVAVEPVLVSVHDTSFEFTGFGGSPTTVAGFLPAHLNHLDIFVPSSRSDAVDQAALRLAAHLTHRYEAQPSFAIVEGTPPLDWKTGPFDRSIAISEAASGSISIEQNGSEPYLAIAGDGKVLDQLAQSLAAPEAALFTGDEVAARPVAEQADQSAGDLATDWTLGDLGVKSLGTEGALSLQIAVPLHQSQFGAPVSSIRARLAGFVTGQDADPVVTVALNGETLSVLTLDHDGRFDTAVQIEPGQLNRENLLTVHSDIDFSCEDSLPWHRLQLSNDSQVDVEFGQTLPPSLERFPQAALPGITVDPGPNASGLEVAVNAVASLQQSSRTVLRPTVGIASAIAVSEGAGLIVADSTDLSGVPGLIEADSGRILADGIEFSGAEVHSVSLIQALEGPTGQDLLVVHLAETSTQRLLDELSGRRWQLEGRAFGFNQDTEVRLAAADDSGPAGPLAFVEDDSPSVARSFGLGVIGAALLYAGVTTLGALRRRLG